MKATVSYQAITCTSDNTRICYGKNNGFTTNDWRKKHIFCLFSWFCPVANFAVFARPSQKIIHFVNFIAELTILDISVGKFCLRHLIQDCSVRDKNCELSTNHPHYYKCCRWWQKICLNNQAFIKWTFKIILILNRHENLHFTLKVSRVTNITFLLTIIINTSSSKLVNMRIHKMVTKGRCFYLKSNPLLN